MMRALMTKTLFVLSILLSAQALAFDVGGCSYTITSGTTVEITGRASGNTATDIVIPATVVDSGTTYSVTTIGDGAFYFNALTSVTIGNGVTSIGGYAFAYNALTSVIIPDSVTTIGEWAFLVNDLKSVTIPDSVRTIGDGAFSDNALTRVTIPAGVVTIGESAFGFTHLYSAVFEGDFGDFDFEMFSSNPNLACIQYRAGKTGWSQDFNVGDKMVSNGLLINGGEPRTISATPADCLVDYFDDDGLSYVVISGASDAIVTGRVSSNTDTDIEIPATASDGTNTYSVATIGYSSFYGDALTSVTIPNSVTSIGDFALQKNALTSVTMPDSVTSIGDYAFQDNALTSVTIGNSVTAIGSSAFSYNALTSVTIPDGVTTIGYGAFALNNLTGVTIPDGVTTIGYGAFNGNSLASLTIPDSVTAIGGAAFADNALTSVTIPDSVTAIGGENVPCSWLCLPSIGSGFSFANNPLTSAAFEGNFGTFESNTFASNPNLATITSCEDATGWPQGFNTGSTIIVTEPVNCSAAPDAPLITGIVPGNGQVSISVSVANDGGSPITSYTAYCFGDTFNFDASPTSPITVLGLTNGVSYACAVTAANDAGTSPASAVSAPVTPVAPAPGC